MSPTSKRKTSPKPVEEHPESATQPSVGKTLKGNRIAKDLTLHQVERSTHIRGKYLLALEGDDYDNLPHAVYARGFVQSYAELLGLDGAALARQYTEERGEQEQQLKSVQSLRLPRFVLTPRILTLTVSTVLGLSAAGYLIWQLSSLAAPPKLVVTNPSKDQVVYGSLITISGQVAGGADVYVNDSPILVDGNGHYTDKIALQNGVNTIHVSAKSRLGKTSDVTRNILAHVPETGAAEALPTAPFDGVAVSIVVKNNAATVTVKIDGKDKFRGTMLPGTTQTFTGATSVIVSTTDASATDLIVTNTTVAAKDLGTLGKTRAPKDNFQFDKDTQFQ